MTTERSVHSTRALERMRVLRMRTGGLNQIRQQRRWIQGYTYSGSVAESMGRMVGKTQLPVEETESGTAPMGMPEATSGTPSPNPWDLTLSRQNVLFYAEGT